MQRSGEFLVGSDDGCVSFASDLGASPFRRTNRCDDVTASGLENSMSLRKVDLGDTVVPLLRNPRVRFTNSEQKRAQVSAIFYSECSIRGISAIDADAAALDAEKKYEKWWRHSRERKAGIKRQRQDEERSGMTSRRSGHYGNMPSLLSPISENSSHPDCDGCHLNRKAVEREILQVKKDLIEELHKNCGETTGSVKFDSCLQILQTFFEQHGQDVRWLCGKKPDAMDGSWLTLSKPTYSDCQGRNSSGEYLYSLGRMSFDMFRPAQFRCSIQGIFNQISPLSDINKLHRTKTMPFALRRAASSRPLAIREYE